MLLVGFRPTVEEGGCVYAATKLRMLVQNLARKAVTDLRIPISQSASAFIVPDTQGLLAPDEVFVSFAGDEPIDPETGRVSTLTLRVGARSYTQSINYLEGDCILFRYPCKLPTDVRKFKAVVKRELCDLRGCIVLSADKWKCTASPASFLAGGDYDGDIATVVWDPALVVPFKDAPDTDALPPEDFGSNFVKHVTSVRDFLSAVRRPNANSASGNPNPNRDSELDSATLIANLQHFLLGSLLDEHLTGVYSELHAVSVYTRGCGHPDTRRLAHMFCSVLDARKSGLSVPPSVKSDDYRKNPGELAWIRAKKEKGDEAYNVRYAQRPVELGPFIVSTSAAS
jgi:hypothetical protein